MRWREEIFTFRKVALLTLSLRIASLLCDNDEAARCLFMDAKESESRSLSCSKTLFELLLPTIFKLLRFFRSFTLFVSVARSLLPLSLLLPLQFELVVEFASFASRRLFLSVAMLLRRASEV